MNNHLVPLLTALPLLGGFLAAVIPDNRRRAANGLTFAITVILCLVTLRLWGQVVSPAGPQNYWMGGWPPPLGIFLTVDILALFLLLAVNLLGLTAALYGFDYLNRYPSGTTRYQSLFLILVAGMNGVVISGDIFNIYVFLEITAIASYALVAFGTGDEELEAGFKYAIMGIIGSAFILLSIALIYGIGGTLNLAHLKELIVTGEITGVGIAFGLLMTGLLLKAAAVPFHAWLPDAHSSAPAPISALLSGAVVKALGVYLILRLVYQVFFPLLGANALNLLLVAGLLSMLVGALLALSQKDLKRLYAYSTISQVGYILFAAGIGTPLGFIAAVFHLFNHAIFKGLLFLNAGAVEESTGSRNVDKLRGLGRWMPQTAAAGTVGALSTAGLPPFAGFWSKMLIILAAFQAGLYAAGVLALLTALLTLAYFLYLQQRIFWEEPASPPGKAIKEAPVFMRTAMAVLAVVALLGGVLLLPGIRDKTLAPLGEWLEEAKGVPVEPGYLPVDIQSTVNPEEITP